VNPRPSSRPLGEDLRRALQDQLDAVLRLGEGAEADPVTAVHEIRKALKRVRAWLRLARSHLGEEVFGEENRAARDMGRLLGTARDSDIHVETLAIVLEALPETEGSPPVLELARRLEVRRALVRQVVLADDGPMDQVVERAGHARDRAATLPLDGLGPRELATGVGLSYAAARTRFREAKGSGDPDRHHSWRKRVKDLQYQLQLLAPRLGPGLRRRLDAQERMGSHLGLANDLANLGELLHQEPVLVPDDDVRDRVVVTAYRMRDRAWRDAGRIGSRAFRRDPEELEDRVREALDRRSRR
jgi:CHAD domain-containing protein